MGIYYIFDIMLSVIVIVFFFGDYDMGFSSDFLVEESEVIWGIFSCMYLIIYLIVYFFCKYLLRFYCILGVVLSVRVRKVNKIRFLFLKSYCLVRGKDDV